MLFVADSATAHRHAGSGSGRIGTPGLSQRQFDAESGAAPRLRPCHEDAAAMVLGDNAPGERESKPPAAFLGGIAGIEYRLVVLVGDAFAVVGHRD